MPPDLEVISIDREAFSVAQCAMKTRVRLERLWVVVSMNWLEQNTELFDTARYGEYVEWNQSLLVRGSLTVIAELPEAPSRGHPCE